MDTLSLQTTARELSRKAAEARSGRAADTVFGGRERRLRQTVVALRAGAEMAEHEGPGEATLLVLSGRLEVVGGESRWQASEWDYLVVPNAPHSVEAKTDTTFLLTVATGDR